MLSPRYLAGLSDEIVEIYAQLEADILADMARRIARLGKVTAATNWQAQLLAETGALKKDVIKKIAKYSPAIKKEITAIYNDALIKSVRADNKIFMQALGHGVSEPSAQIMLASIQKTYSDLSRLTITTAATTEQLFIQQANAAYMQVVTGGFDYDTATRNACDKLAKRGITAVQYNNGVPVTRTIEAAVRMNVLTGVNQTAANITLNNCEELECDLVETSAHIGARPSHEDWQGEVFSISGKSDKYRPFSVCGLGEPDGICGINCRHSYYPYFEGLPEHYGAAELEEMNAETVEYNGEKIPRYEAEQQLRGYERNIRYYKRRADTEAAAGLDNTAAREKIGEWQAKTRDFVKQTGLERDNAREFIGTMDGKQPAPLQPKKNITIAAPQIEKEYKAIVKKYGDKTQLLEKATKKELETIRTYKAAESAGRVGDYAKALNTQVVDYAKLNELTTVNTTIEQRDAVRTWTGSSYGPINDYLRNGGKISDKLQQTADTLHDYLQTREYPAMYVKRGANYKYMDGLTGGDAWRKNPQSLLYQQITDKGFLATTPSPTGGFSGDIMIYYKVPEKSKAAYIAELSHYKHERETLFINNTSAIIKEIKVEKLGGHTRYTIFADIQ